MGTIHNNASRQWMIRALNDAKEADFSKEEMEGFRQKEMLFHECIEERLIERVIPEVLRDPGNLIGIKPIKEDREFQAVTSIKTGELTIAGIARDRLFNVWVTCYVYKSQYQNDQKKENNFYQFRHRKIIC